MTATAAEDRPPSALPTSIHSVYRRALLRLRHQSSPPFQLCQACAWTPQVLHVNLPYFWLHALLCVSMNKQLPRLSKSFHYSTAIIPVAVVKDVAVRTTPLTAVAVTVSKYLVVVSQLYLSPAIYPHAILSNHPCFLPHCPISFPCLL